MSKTTVQDILNLKPCSGYTEEYVTELWNGKESLSRKEILNLNIPIDDRSWVLTLLVPTETVVQWAQHCADKAKEYDANAAREAAYWSADAAESAYWSADSNEPAAWIADAAAAARAAASAASAGKNREEILKELLTTLIEIVEN